MPPQPEPRPPIATLSGAALASAALVVVAAGVVRAVIAGTQADAAPRAASAAPAPIADAATSLGLGPGETALRVLLALAVIVVASRVCGALLRRLHQPPVIGEVVAGIALGPSVLGALAPGVMTALFPAGVVDVLGVVAQTGVCVFLFLVGVHLDTAAVRARSASALLVASACIAVPFAAGTALAPWLHSAFAPPAAGFPGFALFLGIAMSVTAFPVLARILADRGIAATPVGTIALAAAATGDVAAWCLLAAIVPALGVGLTVTDDPGIAVLGPVAVYAAVMFAIVRPGIRLLAKPGGGRSAPAVAFRVGVVTAAAMASAWCTHGLGVHALFGAFLVGVLVPADSDLARDCERWLGRLVVPVILPAFFALTGLRTDLGLVGAATGWAACAAIIAVAVAGKWGAALFAGRLTGLGWRDAATLGVLMNTRGLMELVVLSVGLERGALSPALFAMFVVMALATTLATSPFLSLLGHPPIRAACP